MAFVYDFNYAEVPPPMVARAAVVIQTAAPLDESGWPPGGGGKGWGGDERKWAVTLRMAANATGFVGGEAVCDKSYEFLVCV